MKLSPKTRIVLARAFLSLFALACIGAGVALIYRPAALIVVGLLVWTDLTLWAVRDAGLEQPKGPRQ